MRQHTTIKGFEKFKLVFILAFMSALAPLSTDMYLPALPKVSQSFEVNDFYTQLSLASFFIAFALGQLIYGPLSDFFGRKKPLYVGMALFIASSMSCVLVDSIYAFIALRFLEALGGCAGVVIARAIVNDNFEIKDAAAIFALMMVVSSLAPMLSPSFGSLLLQFFPWQSIFATLFILGVLLFFCIIFGLQESAPAEKQPFSSKEVLKSYKAILRDKPFVIYVFSGAFAMAAMFAYITGSAFVFMNIFELSEKDYAIVFAINALGFMLSANINAKIVQSISPFRILTLAFIAMSGFGAVLVGVGVCNDMRLFGDSKNIAFYSFEVAMFLMLAMKGFIMPNLTTLAMARFKAHSGSASALLGTTQFALAGLVSFSVGALNANTPIFLSCIMALCVWAGCVLYLSVKRMIKAES